MTYLKTGFYFIINYSQYSTVNNPIKTGFSIYYYNDANKTLNSWIGTGFNSDEKWIEVNNLIKWLRNFNVFFEDNKNNSHYYISDIESFNKLFYSEFGSYITNPKNYNLSAIDIIKAIDDSMNK